MVRLDGSVIGGGQVLVNPIGEISGTGFLYSEGTEVTLTAIANVGWVFFGWFGDIESTDSSIVVQMTTDTLVSAFFIELAPPPPPPPPPIAGAVIVAADGQPLGVVSTNQFDADSIANSFGTFGNPFGSLSIWNEFGQYGSNFGSLSAYNASTSTPPSILINGVFDSFLTKNTTLSPRVDPDDLARAVGRPEVARD